MNLYTNEPRMSCGLTVAQWNRRQKQKTEHAERYASVLGIVDATIDATSGNVPTNEHAKFNRWCALTRWAIAGGCGSTVARTLANIHAETIRA